MFKTEYAHREREKEAQRGISYYNATVTNDNQPMQKVTKSLYIVTNLGQLPFMLATEMARTWATQEDSVNTSIIHLYSTLPRNGRIHRLSKRYRYKQRFSDMSVLFEYPTRIHFSDLGSNFCRFSSGKCTYAIAPKIRVWDKSGFLP